MKVPVPRPGETYRHYRTGGTYRVVMLAQHTEDPAQRLVVYQGIKDGKFWARPLEGPGGWCTPVGQGLLTHARFLPV